MENHRNQLILKTPASWFGAKWREGLPCGNGLVGALVYGAIKDETIQVNHAELWHWGVNNPLPDVSSSVNLTRELLDKGEFHKANNITSHALLEAGYEAELYKPCPLGDIKWFMYNESVFQHYRRVLDMENAEIRVTWDQENQRFERKVFVSRKDNLVALKLSTKKQIIHSAIRLQLHETYGEDTKKKRLEIGDSLEIHYEGGYMYYAAENEDGTDFGMVAKVLTDGKMTFDECVEVEDASEITMLVKTFVKGNREDAFMLLKGELEQTKYSYDELLVRHRSIHKPLYHSSDIKLAWEGLEKSNEELLLDAYEDYASNVLLEKLWRYGRYLFICGTRKNAQPFPLYGLWGGEYNLIWSHHMANINIQMIYWHCLAGNLIEDAETLIDYYMGLIEEFRENARQIFGMKGIYLSAGSTPGLGRANQIVPIITNWISGAGWIAQHFYAYYTYTGNRQVLEDKILPFMYEAALFYEDYLVLEDTGKYKIYPSISPENTPSNLMPEGFKEFMGHGSPTSINATMDFAVMKELFTNLIEASEATGKYKECIPKWKELLDGIPGYQMNADGSVKEWMHMELSDNHYHRHISHMYPVFPGNEVTYEKDEVLMEGFKKSLYQRILGGQTGWSLAHMSCVYARFREPEKAIECIDVITRGCMTNSFLTLHNDWRKMGISLDLDEFAPIQLDANMGIVGAIQEMLLFIDTDLIHVLPACPARWKKGSISNMRFHTGQISFEWDLEKSALELTVVTLRQTNVVFKLPSFITHLDLEDKNKDITLELVEKNQVRITAPANKTIQIR